MNNDFNFRPAQPRPQPDAADSSEAVKPAEFSEATSEPSHIDEPAVSRPQVITSDRKGAGFTSFLKFLVVLLLVAAAAGGVYYWQQKQVTDLTASRNNLSNQISSLQSQLAKKNSTLKQSSAQSAATATAAPDIITVSPSAVTPTTATASVQYTGKATQLWVESGTQPDQLTTISKKVAASAESDVENFQLTGLKSATRYYYRAAGTVDGKTVYGGVIMFISSK